MNRYALSLAAALALATGGAAFAQAAPELDELDADRISPTQVEVEFEWDGSSCDQVGTVQLGENANGVLALSFPTTTKAEVCTMQIVEHEVKQTIDADQSVTQVNVTLLKPDGTVAATGTDEVEDD
ncbi:MAG: hypothetical protein JWR39_2470 [Devosia sp.]|jgi:hypothetical protein|nr:hypothetical protein [Devosia sp.]